MRIRYPILGAFIVFLLLTAYISISSFQIPQANPQVLHFLAFFILALLFYWIFDASRRRVLNLTLISVTIVLGLGSEAAQGLSLPREFDPLMVAANILGSLVAVGLCTVYHKRMLDRRRRAKGYGLVPQAGDDIEMGPQETGVVDESAGPSSAGQPGGDGDTSADGK